MDQHSSNSRASGGFAWRRLVFWLGLTVVGLIIAAGAVVAVLALDETGPIQVSATAVRPNHAGELAAMRVPTPRLQTPPTDPFANFSITDNEAEQQLEFEITGLPRLEFEPDYDVHEAKAVDDWIETPDGRVRLIAIGLALPDPEESGDHYVPVEYFHPADLRPVPVDALPRGQRQSREYVHQGLPTYRFIFEFERFDAPDAIGYWFRDTSTEASISSGYSYSTRGDSAYVEIDSAVFHGPGIDLAMELAHGPVIEHEIPAEVGQVWRHGPLHLEVLRRLSRRPGGSYSHGQNGDRVYGSMLYRADESDPGPFHGVLVGILPHRNVGGLDMDLVDPQGEVVRDRAHVSMNTIRYLGGEVEAEQIAGVRFQWRPHFKRFLWRIPALPVVDPANRGVTDLMQVRVPYAHLEREWEMRDLLEEALQVDVRLRPPFDPPPGYFPTTFRDVAVREILDDYLKHVPVPVGSRVTLDESTMTLSIEPTLFTRVREAVARFVDRWF